MSVAASRPVARSSSALALRCASVRASPASIGQQPIERAARDDARGIRPTRRRPASPDLVGRERAKHPLDILPRLDERVRARHQQHRNPSTGPRSHASSSGAAVMRPLSYCPGAQAQGEPVPENCGDPAPLRQGVHESVAFCATLEAAPSVSKMSEPSDRHRDRRVLIIGHDDELTCPAAGTRRAAGYGPRPRTRQFRRAAAAARA